MVVRPVVRGGGGAASTAAERHDVRSQRGLPPRGVPEGTKELNRSWLLVVNSVMRQPSQWNAVNLRSVFSENQARQTRGATPRKAKQNGWVVCLLLVL